MERQLLSQKSDQKEMDGQDKTRIGRKSGRAGCVWSEI